MNNDNPSLNNTTSSASFAGTNGGYLFDFGGTIDTNGCHWGKMLWHGYQRQNIPISEEDFRKAYVYAERTLGRAPIIQSDYTFKKTLSIKLRIEFEYLQEKGLVGTGNFNIASEQSSILNDLYSRVVETTSKAREVLLKLKENHPLVLVSNFYGNMNVVLEEFGLSDIFNKVIESAVVGVRKPDPAIFKLGIDALGLPVSDITYVGDSFDKDIVPANKLGLHTVWIKGEQWDDTQHDETVPDKIITDFSQLLEV